MTTTPPRLVGQRRPARFIYGYLRSLCVFGLLVLFVSAEVALILNYGPWEWLISVFFFLLLGSSALLIQTHSNWHRLAAKLGSIVFLSKDNIRVEHMDQELDYDAQQITIYRPVDIGSPLFWFRSPHVRSEAIIGDTGKLTSLHVPLTEDQYAALTNRFLATECRRTKHVMCLAIVGFSARALVTFGTIAICRLVGITQHWILAFSVPSLAVISTSIYVSALKENQTPSKCHVIAIVVTFSAFTFIWTLQKLRLCTDC